MFTETENKINLSKYMNLNKLTKLQHKVVNT